MAKGNKKVKNNTFFFNEYKKLPPFLRTVNNLHNVLQSKQEDGELPFKLVSITTLYAYKKKMDWDKRIVASLGKDSKVNHMINTDNFMNELWKDAQDYHEITRQQKDKLRWNQVESLEDTTLIQNLKTIQDQYDKSFKTLAGTPISIAEMYAMLEVLKATEQEDSNNLDLSEKLLTRKRTNKNDYS